MNAKEVREKAKLFNIKQEAGLVTKEVIEDIESTIENAALNYGITKIEFNIGKSYLKSVIVSLRNKNPFANYNFNQGIVYIRQYFTSQGFYVQLNNPGMIEEVSLTISAEEL